jgi:hypothetical protein
MRMVVRKARLAFMGVVSIPTVTLYEWPLILIGLVTSRKSLPSFELQALSPS